MIKILVLLIICIFLLFLSAFFSGSETALFSLDEPEIGMMRTDDRRRNYFFGKLLHGPHDLLSTILLSNTVCNVTFSFLVTLIFLEFVSQHSLNVRIWMVVDTICVTLFLLIFGEFTPKFYAIRRRLELSRRSALPLFYLSFILKPFVYVLNSVSQWIIKLLKKRVKDEISFSEIKTLFEIGEKEGVLRKREKEIIRSLFTLSESTVSEVMIPRIKVFFLDGNLTINDVYPLLLEKPYSRIPVYSTSEEKIEGILYLKDLLIHRKEGEKKVKTILRDAVFVPEKMRLRDLFLEFRKKRVHFAIVVNEFGGTEGVVTMHDILEEIVGSIQDEYERVSKLFIRYIAPNKMLVDGELKIEDFPREFSPHILKGDYETLAGFMQSFLGRVPEEDESFVFKDLIFTVVEVEGRKIRKILVSKRISEEKGSENFHREK
jgi:putative hemolysin